MPSVLLPALHMTCHDATAALAAAAAVVCQRGHMHTFS